jgi:hypothetical protein
MAMFPFEQIPWSGFNPQLGGPAYSDYGFGMGKPQQVNISSALGLQPAKIAIAQNYPNPFTDQTTFRYDVTSKAPLTITISDMTGYRVATIFTNKMHEPGTYEANWRVPNLKAGLYVATLSTGTTVLQTVKLLHNDK